MGNVLDRLPPGSRIAVIRLRSLGDCVLTTPALALLKEYRPDLIILDVMLPDINGKEVCHRVRADSTMEDVRIICISGMIEDDKVQELKLAGADDFLPKPFDVDVLIEKMCAQLDIETGVLA